MRIWDVHVKHLRRKHLLGEHRELHDLWNILTKHGGKGREIKMDFFQKNISNML